MKKPITASGILRHCFWGEYSARIALKFPSREDAMTALPFVSVSDPGTFHDVNGGVCQSKGWQVPPGEGVLVCHVGGEGMQRTFAKLEEFGADRRKLESLAKSIDFGEPFTITIEVEVEDPAQLPLTLT